MLWIRLPQGVEADHKHDVFIMDLNKIYRSLMICNLLWLVLPAFNRSTWVPNGITTAGIYGGRSISGLQDLAA